MRTLIEYDGRIVAIWLILATAGIISGQLHEQYVGCFMGNGYNQEVEPAFKDHSYMYLTIEICIQKCYNETDQPKSDMMYAALNNGRQCTCRNNFGQQLHDRNCHVKCSGSQMQNCGGSETTQFYSLYTVCPVGYFGLNCNQSCHCKRHLPCDRKTGICQNGCDDQWNGRSCNMTRDIQKQYIGCYGDGPVNEGKHAMDVQNLGWKTGLNMTNTNSNDFCIEICSNNNYTYAGMQYGYDCQCGEKYDRYGTKTHNGMQVNCSFSCPANGNQKCGGNFANSVYYVCPVGFYGRNCTNRCHCIGNPCRFNGTCLNSTNSSCKPGWTGSACTIRDCTINNGDCQPEEKCETADLGFANLSVCRCKDGSYRDNNTCRETSLHYVGCYKGNTTHHMSEKLPTSDALTIEFCITKCKQLNKTYSLLQGGVTCVCGDDYNGQTIPDADCKVPCAGSTQQYCGGNKTGNGAPIYMYVVYTVTDIGLHWCPNDTNCKSNETCNVIDLKYATVSRCRCKLGFRRMSKWEDCTDVDECQAGASYCNATSENCNNTVGGYICECRDGFVNISGKCEGEQFSTRLIKLMSLILGIIILVFVLFCFLRKRIFGKKEKPISIGLHGSLSRNSKYSEDQADDGSRETSLYDNVNQQTSYKIPVGELPALFKAKISIPGTFEKEFKSVPVQDSTESCREGKKKELKKMNRFQNIIPYDKNRVILQRSQSNASDYINASFINSYNCEEKLIAAQGPNPETVINFWEMIYENNVGTVVMIANLVENGKKKCACYWPESEDSLICDDMTITLKLTERHSDYVIRHLQLVKGSSMMDITQWHFTVWPDHGVPSEIKGFLNFRRSVRQSMSLDKYTIVHCSAGVGRTGTFIAINYLLEQAETEGMVDILGCLTLLRQQRTQMVQTLAQYEFIYAALATEFTIGETIINAEDFERIYQQLLARDESGKSQLEIQFQALQEKWVQQDKSENPLHVFRRSMVMLKTKEVDRTVFVQGWKTKDAYIVPDYPDQATINHFWTICLDRRCRLVINLDNGQNAPPFFPNQPAESLFVDNWRLQCKSNESEQYGTRLKVALSHISESEYANAADSAVGGEVTLFNVKAYVNDTQLDYDAIHATHNAMKSLDSKNGAEKSAIAIVSRPSCVLSGLFIAAFNAFDMLDEAKEVDLYQVVCDIKKSRSEFIPSLAAYEELHNIVNHRIRNESAASVYSNV